MQQGMAFMSEFYELSPLFIGVFGFELANCEGIVDASELSWVLFGLLKVLSFQSEHVLVKRREILLLSMVKVL